MKTLTLKGRHRSLLPSQPDIMDPQENLLYGIVYKHFMDEKDRERWYQGRVTDYTTEDYKIKYESGDIEYFSPEQFVGIL